MGSGLESESCWRCWTAATRGANLKNKQCPMSSTPYKSAIKANLSSDRKEVCPKMQGKPRKTQERGFKPKMKIPPAVQMTAGGMLIFLVVSKKHRHVKRQTPDSVFLHHIFKIGLRSGRSAPSGLVFSCPAAENAGVFFAFLYSRESKNRSTVFRLESVESVTVKCSSV